MQSQRKAQSAMEYLMTYGWAILIIAVVLGALYQLGVFNPSTFQGKAQPGNCQVLRPNGPNTTQLITLQGVCSSQLPQFVAVFPGSLASYVGSIPDKGFPMGTNSVSIFAWVKTSSTVGFVVQYGPNSITTSQNWLMETYSTFCVSNAGNDACTTKAINDGSWHHVGLTYTSGNSVTAYVDGVGYPLTFSATPSVVTAGSTSMYIGYGCCGSGFNGQISNVQLYNSSLSANGVTALYNEGIGGAPIRLQNLIGWWPLNSNPNDYSGDLLNGVANGISYSGNWKK
ncbi:MAG: LamG domain-containing protein [Candidatus Micrarchaeota archaeon]|nr:LamG domain-containing protein [Candidatus Micrarchaeota archaeon]